MIASNDHKINIIKFFDLNKKNDIYFFNCIFYRKGRTASNFKVLSSKVFLGDYMQKKYMFSNSKIIVSIIVISILTKNNRDYDLSHNRAALTSSKVS